MIKSQKKEIIETEKGIIETAYTSCACLPDPEEEVLKKEKWEIIVGALSRLPENYRHAIVNVRLEGCSYREAAEIMGCKESDVKRWVHRGICRLKEILKSYCYWKVSK